MIRMDMDDTFKKRFGVSKSTVFFGAIALAVLAFYQYQRNDDLADESRTLLDRVGGEAMIDATVTIFYKKMLTDPRVKRFFEKADMVHQAHKQRCFLLYLIDPSFQRQYTGLSMDRAHRRMVKYEGLNDTHFDVLVEHLNNTMKELKIDDDARKEVMARVESFRDQVLCRGKWAIDPEEIATTKS